MKLFADRDIRRLFAGIALIWAAFLAVAEGLLWHQNQQLSWSLLLVSLAAAAAVGVLFFVYCKRRNRVVEQAISQIHAYLAGDRNARIECDREGDLYRLFHAVNSLAAVLNAHVDNELREKEFLKNTISDISHQLKTPLAALNIYNGLLQAETAELPELKEFADLSEQELDRMETLVQNLLKITRLDAGSIQLEKKPERVAALMEEVAQGFAYRARQEQKEIRLFGAEELVLRCDRDWLREAVDNLVKNALDHTDKGGIVEISWKGEADFVQIRIQDNGCGIHPEDLYYVFKRFYRSRFSKDTRGIGLGLPLAKAIVEAHGGTIEVDSELGQGAAFTLRFFG